MFESILTISAGVVIGLCCMELGKAIGTILYAYIKATDFKAMLGKLSKKKAIAAEKERIRKKVRVLLDTKPAKVSAYKKGDKRVVDYLRSRLTGMDELLVHEILMEELNK